MNFILLYYNINNINKILFSSYNSNIWSLKKQQSGHSVSKALRSISDGDVVYDNEELLGNKIKIQKRIVSFYLNI